MTCWIDLVSFLSTLCIALPFATAGGDANTPTVSLIGAGVLSTSGLYQDAIFAYHLVNNSVSIAYDAIGSHRGSCRIMKTKNPTCDAGDNAASQEVDFATSDSILEESDYQRNHDLQMYPTVAVAVVPIYNLGKGINLTLTMDALAQIFTGRIRLWNDTHIVDTNPGFATQGIPLNQPIEVVVRNTDSGITEIFKRALAEFEPYFAEQIGVSSAPVWRDVQVTSHGSPHAYVSTTPYTISYTIYDTAVCSKLPIARLNKNDAIVEASPEATQYALLEEGLTFGNNGDDPVHLTANINGAKGAKAWPIVSYTYLIMRKSTLPKGGSCEAVRATASFWYWFWTSGAVKRLADAHSFATLPVMVRDFVVQRFLSDIQCDGVPVLRAQQPLLIEGSGVDWVHELFRKFSTLYSLVDDSAAVTYRSDPAHSEEEVERRLDTEMFVASRIHWTPGYQHRNVKLAFAGIGLVAISQFSMILDVMTLAKILDGAITTWLHPDILSLNPSGILDATGRALQDASQPILLAHGPTCSDAILTSILKANLPLYTGAAIAAAALHFDDEMLLRSGVAGTAFAFSVTTLVGEFDSQLKFAQIKRTDGTVVQPRWEAIRSCATEDVYDRVTEDFQLSDSKEPTCYPLSGAVYITVRKSECNMEMDAARTATITFVEWLFLNPSLGEALKQQNVAPLHTLSYVNDSNRIVMEAITCQKHASNTVSTMLIIILAVVGSVLLIIAVGGSAWLWKSTEVMRQLRKKFSDDNVAQECAAAIACFNLEAVEWLNSVQSPNKIQKSFLQIIHLLTEVKPFIPDQLLVALKSNSPEQVEEDQRSKAQKSDHRVSYSHTSYSGTRSHTGTRSSCFDIEDVGRSIPLSSTCNTSNGSLQKGIQEQYPRVPRSPHYRGAGNGEWMRKKCVYMLIRFGFSHRPHPSHPNEAGLAQSMACILTDLVTIGKNCSATIDHVTYDTVALHWGVAVVTSEAPVKAVTAALDMAKLRTKLPADLQDSFKLRISIMQTVCDIATVSAAAHRFFIVGSPDIRRATDIVVQDLAGKCRCEILMTQSLFQEVQYRVECMPRIWCEDVLLWEPTNLRESAAMGDEWMYELQDLDAQDELKFNAKEFLQLFLMVRNGESLSSVHEAANRLKLQHVFEMNAQDHAALAHLLSTLPTP